MGTVLKHQEGKKCRRPNSFARSEVQSAGTINSLTSLVALSFSLASSGRNESYEHKV